MSLDFLFDGSLDIDVLGVCVLLTELVDGVGDVVDLFDGVLGFVELFDGFFDLLIVSFSFDSRSDATHVGSCQGVIHGLAFGNQSGAGWVFSHASNSGALFALVNDVLVLFLTREDGFQNVVLLLVVLADNCSAVVDDCLGDMDLLPDILDLLDNLGNLGGDNLFLSGLNLSHLVVEFGNDLGEFVDHLSVSADVVFLGLDDLGNLVDLVDNFLGEDVSLLVGDLGDFGFVDGDLLSESLNDLGDRFDLSLKGSDLLGVDHSL